MHDAAIWAVCAASIVGFLVRPPRGAEWVWPASGSVLLVVGGLEPARRALRALDNGVDVYFFLIGMMVLSDVARREGLFDWLARFAALAARGSRVRLFALVYGVGVIVTTVLSNDATAIVLTPAVFAAIRAAAVDEPLPYLYACAVVANAASFVLPISNPANLVVYGKAMPTLGAWFATFGLPSVVSIAVTYGLLFAIMRARFGGPVATAASLPPLPFGAKAALCALGATALALLWAAAVGAPLGAVTFACALLVVAILTAVNVRRRSIAGALHDAACGVSWGIVLLVAGLFVLAGACEATPALAKVRTALEGIGANTVTGLLSTGIIAALAANLTNNLPAGLLAGMTAADLHAHQSVRGALMLGIDIGPNLSPSGSLATLLWLAALRREGLYVSRTAFLRIGSILMVPTLALCLIALGAAER